MSIRENDRSKQAVVVGGGFSGLIAARLLSDAGYETIILERASKLGGISRSDQWRGHYLDFGCHLFGNETEHTTSLIIDMAGGPGSMLPVQPQLSSRYSGRMSPDLEYPDLSHRADSPVMLTELIGVAAREGRDAGVPRTGETLARWLERRFGVRVAEQLETPLRKLLRLPSEDISARAAGSLPVRRVILSEPDSADLLKSVPELDDRLCRSWGKDPMRFHKQVSNVFPARCLYPREGGIGGWTDAAVTDLTRRGVKFCTSTTVTHVDLAGSDPTIATADRELRPDLIVWTAGAELLASALDISIDTSTMFSPTPTCLYWFEIDPPEPGSLHYAVSFDQEQLLFRATCPAAWGVRTNADGRAHLCCEVTHDQNDGVARDPKAFADRIFSEAVTLGMAHGHPYAVKISDGIGYRYPKAGYDTAERQILSASAEVERFIYIDPLTFSKANLVNRVINAFEAQGGHTHAN